MFPKLSFYQFTTLRPFFVEEFKLVFNVNKKRNIFDDILSWKFIFFEYFLCHKNYFEKSTFMFNLTLFENYLQLSWLSMCHCPYCGNFKNAICFFNKFGQILKNKMLENITVDNILLYSVCKENVSNNFESKYFCLYSQTYDHCFIHPKKYQV